MRKKIKLADFPNGTVFEFKATKRSKPEFFVLSQGLDGRILLDVSDGTWRFINEVVNLNTRNTREVFNPQLVDIS